MPIQVISDRYVLDAEAPRRGGTALVYRASDHQTAATVAVKLCHAPMLDSEILKEQFERETEALQALKHPNIVELRDSGYDDATQSYYVVLEWVDDDLPSRLRRAPVDGWDSFAEFVLLPTLEALTFAHGRRVVHRDIKPANILITAEGVPKLADFGIAKLLDSVRIGLTVRDFASRPYAPPDRDRNPNEPRGDLYSLGITTLSCLLPTDFDIENEGIDKAIYDANLPDSAAQFLRRLLAPLAADRFAASSLALKELKVLQIERPREAPEHATIFLGLTAAATRSVSHHLRRLGQTSALQFLKPDLTGELAIGYPIAASDRPGSEAYVLYGQQFAYIVAPDRTAKWRFAVLSVDEIPAGLLLERRERAMPLFSSISFEQPIRVSDAAAAMDWIRGAVASHEQQAAIKRAEAAEQELFDKWRRLLDLKQDIERQLEAPLRYKSYNLDGKRILFRLESVPDSAVIGQPRLVSLEDGSSIRGVVDDVVGMDLWFSVRQGDIAGLRRAGQIRVDREASRVALRRQGAALDATRGGRTKRSDLGKLLVHPEQAAAPSALELVPPLTAELDGSQVLAAQTALGSPDITVVDGPPGTGKTTFICELISQYVRKFPGKRVLLSAQTHVAVDNALERLRQLRPDLHLVRVGAREKISPETLDLSLDQQLDRWRTESAEKARSYARSWAEEHGMDGASAQIQMQLEELRVAEQRLKAITDQLSALSEVDTSESSEGSDADVARSAGTSPVVLPDDLEEINPLLADDALDLQATRDQLKRDRRIAVRVAQGYRNRVATSLRMPRQSSFSDIEKKANSTHELDSDTLERFRAINRLQEGWIQVFGIGAEFQEALVARSDVVAGTCLGIASVAAMEDIDFDLVIIDEASKATPTEALVPISLGSRWVLVGDQNQLPPFVDDATKDPGLLEARQITREDLQHTLFDRLLAGLPETSHVSLEVQHRMVRPIGDLISHCFYGGRLSSSREAARVRCVMDCFQRPVIWLSTSQVQGRRERKLGASFANSFEANLIDQWLGRLNFYATGRNESLTVGIISGYDAQRELLERMLVRGRVQWDRLQVDVNTVDAFQGQERDVVFYSVARSNDSYDIGFLRSDRRLNVALSRAKDGLVMVGDSVHCESALIGDNPFPEVLKYIRGHPDDCRLEYVPDGS